MIVCENYKLIYFRTSRCASSSISKFMRSIDGSYSIRATPAAMKRFSGYKKFTIIRNPYDRAVSAWKHILSRIYCYYEEKGVCKNIPIPLDVYLFLIKRYIDIGKKFKRKISIDSGIFYVSEEHKKILWRAILHAMPYYMIKHIDMCNRIGRYEALNSEIDNIFGGVGIQHVSLDHTNCTHKLHYSKYYNKKTKSMARSIYLPDLKKYNYSF